jgi:uncharacterized protein YfaS (alpha-2-macroglobulin family)
MSVFRAATRQIQKASEAASKGTHLLAGVLAGLVLGLVLSGLLGRTAGDPVPVARLTAVRPSSGETVPLDVDINLEFSDDVVPLDEVGQLFSANIIQIQPRLNGQFVWQSPRHLRFLLDQPLAASTRYEGVVDLSVLPVSGGSLERVVQPIEFSTERLAVVDARFTTGDMDSGYGDALRIEVEFNYEVDASQFQRHASLVVSGSGDSVPYTLVPAAGRSNVFTLVPGVPASDLAGTLRLSIDAKITCVGGSLGLTETFEKEFDVAFSASRDDLEVYWVYPESYYRAPGSFCISLGFSDQVDPDTLKQSVKLDPEVPFSVVSHGYELVILSDHFAPRDIYTVTISSGLVSLSGRVLSEHYRGTLVIPDLSPSVQFDDPGMYLPRHGLQSVALSTVNVDEVDIAVYQVFRNNLTPLFSFTAPGAYGFESDLERTGRLIESRTVKTGAAPNTEHVLHIDLSRYDSSEYSGVYGVVIRDRNRRWLTDSRLIVSSDLGITFKAGAGDLLAFVCSIKTLEPVEGSTVSVMSSNNQLIASAVTDRMGIARFGDLRPVLSQFEPYIVTVERGGDFSFLPLGTTQTDLVEFDTSGRDVLQQGYETFLYMDRELFRPGDEAHIAGFVRGPKLSVPQPLPARLVVHDPGGDIFREFPILTGDLGSFELALDIPSYAMTGEYSVSLLIADRETGHCKFMVEEFMPERIKVGVRPDFDTYLLGDTALIEVSAESLLGTAVPGRDAELSILLRPSVFTAEGYTSYCFTDNLREYSQSKEIIASGVLSEDGIWRHSHEFTDPHEPPSSLEVEFRATVTEIGGRASHARAYATYHPYGWYVGLKLGSGEFVELDEPIAVNCVAVDPGGQPVADASLRVEVYTVQYSTIYHRGEDGRYHFETRRQEEKVFEDLITPGPDGTAELKYIAERYGRHRVVVSDASMENGHRASAEFYATDGRLGAWGPWSGASPDELVLEPDQISYTPGGTAVIRLTSPFAGKALITIERERVLDAFARDVPEGISEISIPIEAEYVPNVYVTAQVIRSPEGLDRHAAVKAFGTVSVPVEASGNKLSATLSAPEVIRPGRPFTVEVQVDRGACAPGVSTGPTVVTLAAVDEGICQITGYDVPSPFGFFYGKKRLSVSTYDLYRLLLSEPRPITGSSSPGGDLFESALYYGQRHLDPISARRVEPVSLWSGLVNTDAEGKASVTLGVPEFSGTLRLMAVAASGSAFGSCSTTAIVEDEVVVTMTLPRFASTGDSFTIPVSVRNATGSDGVFSVGVSVSGALELTTSSSYQLALRNNEEAVVSFAAAAKAAPGTATIRVTATGNGAESCSAVELPVRPAVPFMTEVGTGSVTPGEPVALKADTQFVQGTSSYSLTIGPLPTAQLGSALQYLVQYPYGCLEQTVSSCFPLLYYRELAAQTDPRMSLTDVSYFVDKGIDKIESMQLSDGSFRFWPGSFDRSLWSSIYASHFLIEAKNAGYQVSERVYDRMIAHLQALANRNPADSEETECRIYALYVLSLAGKPSLGNLAYLKKSVPEGLPAFSRAQLAAALALAGDREGARQVAPDKMDAVPVAAQTGSTFRSPARDDAVMLHALVSVDPENPAVYALSKRIIEAMDLDGTWGTTQRTSFALLALGKAASVYEPSSYTGTVSVDGSPIAEFDSSSETAVDLSAFASALSAGRVTLGISGNGTAYYALTASGVPLSPTEISESDRGIRVRRELLDRDGNPVDLDNIHQGDVVIAHIAVSPEVENLENVVIVDMLPAGLEIENPRLGRDVYLPWAETDSLTPDYMDVRDDRMILFTDFYWTGEYHFYYALRAVTEGSFVLPPIKAECMYDPAVYSMSGQGSVRVRESVRRASP